MAEPWDDKWWRDQYGNRAREEWAATTWRLLTRSQQIALEVIATGERHLAHGRSVGVLRRKGLVMERLPRLTEAGRAVLEASEAEEEAPRP